MLKYHWQRNVLVYYLDELADKDRHQRSVAQNLYTHNMDFVIHFLYDDTGFNDDTEGMVGIALVNHDEANHVRNLINALDIIWDKYGMEMSDEEFINCPKWPQVIEAANQLLTLIKENDRTSFWKRENLVFYLEILAEQRQRAMEHTWPSGMSHDLLNSFDFLYVYTYLASDTEANIGDILLNHDEANYVRNLINVLDVVRDKYGKDNADEKYFNSPEWFHVKDAASKLLTLIKANDSAKNS
jgi:hypothetical protein